MKGLLGASGVARGWQSPLMLRRYGAAASVERARASDRGTADRL
jgi:hypothetical protein